MLQETQESDGTAARSGLFSNLVRGIARAFESKEKQAVSSTVGEQDEHPEDPGEQKEEAATEEALHYTQSVEAAPYDEMPAPVQEFRWEDTGENDEPGEAPMTTEEFLMKVSGAPVQTEERDDEPLREQLSPQAADDEKEEEDDMDAFFSFVKNKK